MEGISTRQLKNAFPYESIRPLQEEVLKAINNESQNLIFEMPTGEGKTGPMIAALIALAKQKKGPLFFVTPTKTQVDKVYREFPDITIPMYGRSEYSCLYYENKGIEGVTAEESPCYMLKCDHRVDQETGATCEENVKPCPYFQQKYLAKTLSYQGKIVVCTTAFFIINRMMVDDWREMKPALVALDEVHNIAKISRRLFENTLTDYYLKKAYDLIEPLDSAQAKVIKEFTGKFQQICWTKEADEPVLLRDADLVKLMKILEKVETKKLDSKIRKAIKAGKINPIENKNELKNLENLILKIPKVIRSISFAMGTEERFPLNYVVAFYYKKSDPEFSESRKKARFFLTIYGYYVAALIKKSCGEKVIACSATIGDAEILGHETGLKFPFYPIGSSFDAGKTRIYMPTDTPNLAMKKRRRNDLNKSLRTIIRGAKDFSKKGLRSLIIVISEMERQKIIRFSEEMGLNVISYDENTKPKQAIESFKAGNGEALLGTAAVYGEGIDLPDGIAPVIFFLRPGYSRPNDPEAQFEDRRFSNSRVWALRRWRVMIEALQARGRNIRSAEDQGISFFISQGFKGILFSALPEWLKPAYNDKLSMDEAIKDGLKLLKKQKVKA